MPLPTVILPGYLASAIDYQLMEQTLNDLGYPTVTVPLLKRTWFPTLGGRSVLPILERLDQTVRQMMQKYDAPKVNLIGHSAGGWISRIYLGEHPYDVHGVLPGKTYLWKAHSWVANLVALGTPHISSERWALRNLNFVNETYPGAFYPDVRYVCVAGKAIFGDRRVGQWLAYSSYQITCGQGNCWGDGITPIVAAHLEGAENITLDNVRHSPRSGGIWYGTPSVIQQWATYLE